jgi:hypothetical protein
LGRQRSANPGGGFHYCWFILSNFFQLGYSPNIYDSAEQGAAVPKYYVYHLYYSSVPARFWLSKPHVGRALRVFLGLAPTVVEVREIRTEQPQQQQPPQQMVQATKKQKLKIGQKDYEK